MPFRLTSVLCHFAVRGCRKEFARRLQWPPPHRSTYGRWRRLRTVCSVLGRSAMFQDTSAQTVTRCTHCSRVSLAQSRPVMGSRVKYQQRVNKVSTCQPRVQRYTQRYTNSRVTKLKTSSTSMEGFRQKAFPISRVAHTFAGLYTLGIGKSI